MKHLQAQIPARQRGIVLVVALLILMVMTIIGTSMLGTASLEERMAANLQTGNSTYQAADSCFKYTITTPDGQDIATTLANAVNNPDVAQVNNCQDPATGNNLYGPNLNASSTSTALSNTPFQPRGYELDTFRGVSIPITVTSSLNTAGTGVTLQISGGVVVP